MKLIIAYLVTSGIFLVLALASFYAKELGSISLFGVMSILLFQISYVSFFTKKIRQFEEKLEELK